MKKVDALTYFKENTKYRTQSALAGKLGIHQTAISRWPEIVPYDCAVVLKRLSRGNLKIDMSLYENRYHGPKLTRQV